MLHRNCCRFEAIVGAHSHQQVGSYQQQGNEDRSTASSFLYSLRREFVMERKKGPARRSGPFLLVTYRCRSFGRAALSDFYRPCREPGSAGPVSGRRLAADRVSDPAIDCADRVGFGSSCCFLSWERQCNVSTPPSFPAKRNRCRWCGRDGTALNSDRYVR